jgi:hypothetical protein
VPVNDLYIVDGQINKLDSVIKLFPGHLRNACLLGGGVENQFTRQKFEHDEYSNPVHSI